MSLVAFVACSGATSEATDGGHDAASDSAKTADGPTGDGPVCSYPPIANDPACPPMYSYGNQGKACAPIGVMCGYPGAGDGTADGCFSTAAMWCRGDAGSADAGSSDAGVGTWTVAQ